jgi:hypothetical protein
LKPARANSFQDRISKKPIPSKKGLVEWLNMKAPSQTPILKEKTKYMGKR